MQKVLILTGPAGAGKTTISEFLEKRCGYTNVDGDEADAELFPEGKHYKPENAERLRLAHGKIFRMAKESFDSGRSVVVHYVIFGFYLEFIERFRQAFGECLEIKVLMPSTEEMIRRDLEREVWTAGERRIREVRAELEALKEEIGPENFIDSTGETPEQTFEKYFKC
jgi:adenylate kinase family enzyme